MHSHENQTALNALPLNNFTSTRAPNASDDAVQGYAPGSRWLDTSTGTLYDCVDASNGSAQWSASGSGGSPVNLDAINDALMFSTFLATNYRTPQPGSVYDGFGNTDGLDIQASSGYVRDTGYKDSLRVNTPDVYAEYACAPDSELSNAAGTYRIVFTMGTFDGMGEVMGYSRYRFQAPAGSDLVIATPNAGLAKLDAALRYVLKVYEESAGRRASEKEIADLTNGIQIVHNGLEAEGVL